MALAPIALSLGDPAGIGPETIVGAWRALRDRGPQFVAIGDAATLERVITVNAGEVISSDDFAEVATRFDQALPVLNMPLASPVVPGRSTPDAAASVPVTFAWIEAGARLALDGKASALVTSPIAKAPLYKAGFSFPGHTEFLGQIAPGPSPPVMMLTADGLRCALVTVHEPLARVSELLSEGIIVETGKTLARALRRDFGIDHPRVAVAGLNPHAGESGTLGDEEIQIVAPAVRALQAAGVDARGPYPSDSLFHAEARRGYDAVLCMYHDQALIPVKMLDFWGGVNVTLGLPIVRTSPDHGVAFDIAGKGHARPDSLIAALRMAASIATRRGAV